MRIDARKRSRWPCLAGMLVTLALPLISSAGEEPLDDLGALRWKNRVVLVDSRGADAALARTRMQADASGVTERDVLWFIVGRERVATNFGGSLGQGFRERLLESYFTPARDDARVILIGKDGGVKSRSPDLDLERLYQRIDGMPMRQREMRERASR